MRSGHGDFRGQRNRGVTRARIDPLSRGVAAPTGYPELDAGDGGRRFFSDVRFPARRSDLYASAVEHGAPPEIVEAIRHLPSEWYCLPMEVPDLHPLAKRYHGSRA